MPGRKYQSGNSAYRYSINAQERSEELNENFTTALYWEYDSRIGRRWNVDPVKKESESPYLTFSGNPILLSDPNGDNANGPDDPPGYVRGKAGDQLGSYVYKGVLNELASSIVYIPDPLHEAQAVNFALAVDASVGFYDLSGSYHSGMPTGSGKTCRNGKMYVFISNGSDIYNQTVKLLNDVYNIKDNATIDALLGGHGGISLIFEEGKDYSSLFWKPIVGRTLSGGPGAMAIPVTGTLPITVLPPGTGANVNTSGSLIVNIETVAAELAQGYALNLKFGKDVVGILENLGSTVLQFAAEHTKNARPSNWNTHSKKRSGKVYDKSQNAKRGAKNRKFQPKENANKRK